MKILVVGGSGGIGQAVVKLCLQQFPQSSVLATFHSHQPSLSGARLTWHQLDVLEESEIKKMAKDAGPLDWIINTVGILHQKGHGPEKSLRTFDPEFFQKNMAINAIPSLLLAKHFQQNLKPSKQPRLVVISARVGSIEDNQLGGWISYRASKAALNMTMKTVSIEWRRVMPESCVALFHPGTTDTALSKPFQKNVPAEKLFSADKTAAYLIALLNRLKPEDTGKFFAYDQQEIPW